MIPKVFLLLTAAGLACFGGEAFPRIDAHAHVAPPPEAFLRMLERLDVRMVNVTLIDPHVPGFDRTEPQTTMAAQISERSRGRIAWVATFDPAGGETPGFAERTIAQLRTAFEHGAVGVKIWKAIGMDLKSKDGRYVLPDDPAFAPVLEMIAASNRTLLAHLGEPRSSWLPLDPADPHYGYYKASPDWYMFLHPERPSYESILAARDRMLAAHPKLRVIGCHLGSMEHDVDEIAKRLDRFPNFAVDTAARVPNLILQPREKVRRFLIRYQDRVLWGTDSMEIKWDNPEQALKRWEQGYAADWRYFATDLALPEPVLRKIFHDNALRWLPLEQDAALPSVDAVIARYVEALGGEAALRKITTRVAQGKMESPTFGAWGPYEEQAKAPDRLVQAFIPKRYGVVQLCFDGRTAWTETPEYGVEEAKGKRAAELRRGADFYYPLRLKELYSGLTVTRRTTIDQRPAIELAGGLAEGGRAKLFFDAETGLLLCVEAPETAHDGSERIVRTWFDDYRPVDGIQEPHALRFESDDVIWIFHRLSILHNVPVEDKRFQR